MRIRLTGFALLAGAFAGSALAATITVTTLTDETTVNAQVSLREALQAADRDASVDGSTAGSGADTIVFDPALVAVSDADIALTLFLPGTNTAEFGASAFRITNNVTIVGPAGDYGITLKRQSGTFRLFHVDTGGTLTLQNLTLARGIAQGGNGGNGNGGGGGAGGFGGAILNEGTLQVLNCTLSGNQALGGASAMASGNNGGGGGGGVATTGVDGTNPTGGAGGKPNGGASNGGTGGAGGGGGGGNHPTGSTGSQTGGDAGAGGFGGGGGGGGYVFTTGSPATAGDGGVGGFGAGGGGGGTAVALGGAETPGTGGGGGFGGGNGDPGKTIENSAGGDGGGGAGMGGAVFNRGGSVTIVNSTLSGNRARGGDCGDTNYSGIGVAGGGSGYGGAVFNRNGTLSISNCTLTGNTVAYGLGTPAGSANGGGIYTLGETGTARLILFNSIVANSTGAAHDVVGGVNGVAGSNSTVGAGNLIESRSGYTGTVVTTSDPLLGGLADNRGPTRTHALLVGSPAIDTAQTASAASTNDQRGGAFVRVADGNLNGTAELDIGAFELVFLDYGDAPDGGVGTGSGIALVPMGGTHARISVMGNDAEAAATNRIRYAAYNPAVAFNTNANEYLAVWQGDDDTAPLVDDEQEIFGARIDGGTGQRIGSKFRVSFMGNDAEANPANRVMFYGADPAVAWGSVSNQYLVVWAGDHATNGLADNETEIWGQRIDASGNRAGGRIRISSMGPASNTSYQASTPDVAYNPAANEFLVVWRADDNTAPVVDDELEIYAQRIGADGALLGSRVRVSKQGNDAQANAALRQNIIAFDPQVAWNSVDQRYLVVWAGDSDVAPMVDNEMEIFGQLLTGAAGLVSTNFRISAMGPNGDTLYRANTPGLAYNALSNQFLVVWDGDDNTAPLVDDESEVFGVLLNGTGAVISARTRLSDMGADGATTFYAQQAKAAFDPLQKRYLVTWCGTDAVENKFTVFGQSVSVSGVATGENDLIIGSTGDADDPEYDNFAPALAFNNREHEFLVVWQGEDVTAPLVNDEREIFARRLLEENIINYNTGAADNGAFHAGRQGIKLGTVLDNEADAIFSVDAQGDDRDTSDDEDGLIHPGISMTLRAGSSMVVTVQCENATGSGGTLYAWVDFDADGQFENATERTSSVVPNGFSGTLTLTFPVAPAGATNMTFARFRLSTDGAAANAIGGASNGEVEDYPVYLPDSDGDGILDGWEAETFGNLDQADGNSDWDGDGFIDRHEYLAGTIPTNDQSFLRIDSIRLAGPNQFELTWPGAIGRNYRIVFQTNVFAAGFQTNVSGVAGVSPLSTATGHSATASGVFVIELQ